LYLPGLRVRHKGEYVSFLRIDVAVLASVPFGLIQDFRKNERRLDGFQRMYLMVKHIVERVRAAAEDIRKIFLAPTLG